MIKQALDFLKDPFQRALIIALLVIGAWALFHAYETPSTEMPASPVLDSNQSLAVHFFYLPGCPHCAEQKPFNEKLKAEFPGVQWLEHDITIESESRLFAQMIQENGLPNPNYGVPMTVIAGKAVVGWQSEQTTGQQLRQMIQNSLESNPAEVVPASGQNDFETELPIIGKTDLKSLSLPVLAILLGLVDGFNPCAMWVLIYLIALVLSLNDKRRLWLLVGTFVLASGILYFLFMAVWLNVFLFLGFLRPITILVGLLALGGGILSIKEFIQTKGALTCKVGGEEGKKKTMNQVEQLINSPLTIATLAGIVLLAFAVNSVEFACSAAIPAVFTQVLALSNISAIEHYAYILLYVLFFMLDDLIIFGLAAFAVSTSVGEKYAKYCKFIGGALMTLIGLILLFAPQLLS